MSNDTTRQVVQRYDGAWLTNEIVHNVSGDDVVIPIVTARSVTSAHSPQAASRYRRATRSGGPM